jgi:hypothetical protein
MIEWKTRDWTCSGLSQRPIQRDPPMKNERLTEWKKEENQINKELEMKTEVPI